MNIKYKKKNTLQQKTQPKKNTDKLAAALKENLNRRKGKQTPKQKI